MQFDEWKKTCEGRLASVAFVSAVNSHLEAIRSAHSLPERAREAGRFGGFLRSMRCSARLQLAEALMTELEVEPTQHVAAMLMKRAFGVAAETATLDRFAKPGRDASEKHMDEALTAAAGRQHLLTRYGQMYTWYVGRLDVHISRLRGKKDPPRSRRDPGSPRRPTSPTKRP